MSATHSKFSPGGEGRLESATQEANSYPGNFSQLQQLFHQVDLRNKDLCFVLDFQENLTLSKFLPTMGTLDFAFLRFEGSFEQCEFFFEPVWKLLSEFSCAASILLDSWGEWQLF